MNGRDLPPLQWTGLSIRLGGEKENRLQAGSNRAGQGVLSPENWKPRLRLGRQPESLWTEGRPLVSQPTCPWLRGGGKGKEDPCLREAGELEGREHQSNSAGYRGRGAGKKPGKKSIHEAN